MKLEINSQKKTGKLTRIEVQQHTHHHPVGQRSVLTTIKKKKKKAWPIFLCTVPGIPECQSEGYPFSQPNKFSHVHLHIFSHTPSQHFDYHSNYIWQCLAESFSYWTEWRNKLKVHLWKSKGSNALLVFTWRLVSLWILNCSFALLYSLYYSCPEKKKNLPLRFNIMFFSPLPGAAVGDHPPGIFSDLFFTLLGFCVCSSELGCLSECIYNIPTVMSYRFSSIIFLLLCIYLTLCQYLCALTLFQREVCIKVGKKIFIMKYICYISLYSVCEMLILQTLLARK